MIYKIKELLQVVKIIPSGIYEGIVGIDCININVNGVLYKLIQDKNPPRLMNGTKVTVTIVTGNNGESLVTYEVLN